MRPSIYPLAVTGGFSGIFELTENQTSPANQGFYSFGFNLNMTNWAFDNNGDLTGQYQDDGEIYSSTFRVITVPVPATLALFGLGLAGLGYSRRKKA